MTKVHRGMEKLRNSNLLRNNRLAWAVCLLAAAAAVVLTSGMKLLAHEERGLASVAGVNGEAVEAREFSAIALSERAKVYAYFQGKYGAGDGTEFWNGNYGGERPREKLKRDALQKMVGIKVLQALGKEYGILADTSYTAYLEAFRRENETRKREADQGRPVYGPKQVQENVYYEMVQSRLLQDLRLKLDDRLRPDEETVSTYYEQHRSEFVKTGATTVKSFAVTFQTDDGGVSRKRAEGVLRTLIEELDAAEDGYAAKEPDSAKNPDYADAHAPGSTGRLNSPQELDAVQASDSVGALPAAAILYCETPSSAYECRERRYDSRTARTDLLTEPVLAQAAKELDRGQRSGIIVDRQSLYVLVCTDKQADGTIPLAEVRGKIGQELGNLAFERYIREEADKARLVVDEEALEAAMDQIVSNNR
ncbi:MAG: peptidylprolyl isomerase [Paenibacillaceae bacterium]|jgi:hypothetical protein|nr:peptidylprolyl isomerase [Paenibacillaceae bacterium]